MYRLRAAGSGSHDDGLYHYRADRHALELRSRGDWAEQIARALVLHWAAESPLIVGLTSIFWREAWKYRDRAYRYCCHDLGHAMMSLLLAARALGLPGGVVAHFSDLRLTHALGLAESDDAPMAFWSFPTKPVWGDSLPRRSKNLRESPTSCRRKKFPMPSFSGCIARRCCPIPWGRCRASRR